ncbi:MAG: hypothetical protein IKE23_12975, partial [Exiguobacterium sp.]|nr:hypothetical protein [Exiguobacterium sp.]
MRLIDADALKQTFCAKCDRAQCKDCSINYHLEHFAPTIDAIEVVRCKDCAYWGTKVVYANGERADCLN